MLGPDNTKTHHSPADVILFSGCKDQQTSADATISGISHQLTKAEAQEQCHTPL